MRQRKDNDISRNIVIGAARGNYAHGNATNDTHSSLTGKSQSLHSLQSDFKVDSSGNPYVVLDDDLVNLLRWLASEQNTSSEIALKRAVATAAYIYDLSVNQGNQLLVKRPDGSTGEIVLK
jgi:hypothetical protein